MPAPDHVFETSDGVIRLHVFGNVFAGVFESPLTAKAFDEVRKWQPKAMPTDGTKIISFSLAFGAHRIPDDVKQAADRLLTEFGQETAASVNVLRAEGFQASAARAMLGTIYLSIRVNYPRKVVATVAEGESWLVSKVGESKSLYDAARWLQGQEREGPRNPHE